MFFEDIGRAFEREPAEPVGGRERSAGEDWEALLPPEQQAVAQAWRMEKGAIPKRTYV